MKATKEKNPEVSSVLGFVYSSVAYTYIIPCHSDEINGSKLIVISSYNI